MILADLLCDFTLYSGYRRVFPLNWIKAGQRLEGNLNSVRFYRLIKIIETKLGKLKHIPRQSRWLYLESFCNKRWGYVRYVFSLFHQVFDGRKNGCFNAETGQRMSETLIMWMLLYLLSFYYAFVISKECSMKRKHAGRRTLDSLLRCWHGTVSSIVSLLLSRLPLSRHLIYNQINMNTDSDFSSKRNDFLLSRRGPVSRLGFYIY